MKIIGKDVYVRKKQRRAGAPVWLQPFLPPLRLTPSENVVQELERLLDDRFVLLCDVRLVGVDHPVPFVLIGPPGIYTLLISEVRRMYRAVQDAWEIYDIKGKKYRSARPNLLRHAALYAHLVQEKVNALGAGMPAVQALLIFADAGIHVDMDKPSVRIVLADAIQRLAVNLSRSERVLTREQVNHVVEYLLRGGSATPSAQEDAEIQDAFSFRDLDEEKPRAPSLLSRLPSEEPRVIRKVGQRFAWSKRQWIIFGVLLLINILILSALILILWISA